MRDRLAVTRRLFCLAIAWLALFAPSAQAVIVNASNAAPTLVAPADDPGWNNVAKMGALPPSISETAG